MFKLMDKKIIAILTYFFFLLHWPYGQVPLSCVLAYSFAGDDGSEVLFGTSDGRVGLVHIGR